MDLFSTPGPVNILPADGEAIYYGQLISEPAAGRYLAGLLEHTAWKNDEAVIYGKHYVTKRKVAWYGDQAFSYTYSNTTKEAELWTPELLELKLQVEQRCKVSFNSCLLNLYHNGEEGMGWHSDSERELGRETVIASLSFGAARKFSFKHKVSRATVSLVLESGSLLVMKGSTQQHWLHSLPKTVKVTRPRINLTFRTILSYG